MLNKDNNSKINDFSFPVESRMLDWRRTILCSNEISLPLLFRSLPLDEFFRKHQPIAINSQEHLDYSEENPKKNVETNFNKWCKWVKYQYYLYFNAINRKINDNVRVHKNNTIWGRIDTRWRYRSNLIMKYEVFREKEGCSHLPMTWIHLRENEKPLPSVGEFLRQKF